MLSLCEFLNLDVPKNGKEIKIDEILIRNKKKIKLMRKVFKKLKIINFICLCNDDEQKELMAKYFTLICPNFNYLFTCELEELFYYLDILCLDGCHIILLPFTKLSKKIHKKLIRYKQKIGQIIFYHHKGICSFYNNKKLFISLMNDDIYLIMSFMEIYNEYMEKFNFGNDYKEEKNCLGLKNNMVYKINLNNNIQNYLKKKDKMKAYISLKNLPLTSFIVFILKVKLDYQCQIMKAIWFYLGNFMITVLKLIV
jgi:hypothetical protein